MKIQPNWNLILKLFITLSLWGGAGAATSEATWAIDRYEPTIMSQVMPLIILAWIGVVCATLLIWGIPEFLKLYHLKILSQTGESTEKNKREGRSRYDDKLALLMEIMDEDERAAFKEALKQQVLDDAHYHDGELPYNSDSLESLMVDETRRKNSRY